MDKKMKFTCSDKDFMAQSDDREELVRVGKRHAKERHGMDISSEEAMAEIKKT